MFNLYQLVSGAQGGRGLDTLAQRFGLTREQADGAVQALLPALSIAFTAKAAQPGGLGEIAGAMTDDRHKRTYLEKDAAADPQAGRDVSGSLFGEGAAFEQVIAHAARVTNLPEDTVRGILPAVVSTILGGAAVALHEGGMADMLRQLAHGGIGGVLGQFGGAATGQGAPGNTGGTADFSDMVGTLMGGLFGGTRSADTQQPASPTPDNRATDAPAADPAAALPPLFQAGLDMFGKMFQSGLPSSGAASANDRSEAGTGAGRAAGGRS